MTASRSLNASGCLDALDRARRCALALDAFVTKTITPLPREGNPPVRIAETETRHAQLDRAAGARHRRRSLDRHAARARATRPAASGSPSVGSPRRDFAGICERLDDRADVETIELNLSCPNVEEAPETSAQIVAGCRARDLEAALREAFAGDLGHRRVGAGGGRGRRGRPLARQHDPRPGARPANAAPAAGPRHGRLLGPALKPIALACVSACAAGGRRADRRHGRRRAPGSMRWSSSRRAQALSRWAPSSSPIPAAPARVRGELAAEAAARGFANPARREGSCQWLTARNPCKSAKTVPLDPALADC